MNSKEVIRRIDQERRAQGITYRAFAKQIGVSTSNYQYWLHGGGITLEKAELALETLGISAVIGKEDKE
jgi:transcriptional regulator with XRE-family HTH domain